MRDARRRSASNGRGAPTPGVRHGGDITGQMYFTTRTSRKKRTFVEGRRELMPGRTILGYCVGMCKTPVLLAGFVLLVYQLGIVTHVGRFVLLPRSKPRTAGKGWKRAAATGEQHQHKHQHQHQHQHQQDEHHDIEDHHLHQLHESHRQQKEQEEEEQQKQQIEQIDQKPSALAGLLGLFGRRRGLGAGGDDSATGGSSGELGSWADEQYCFVEDGVEYCLPQLYGACCVRAGSTALAAYL